ncbi:proteasome beta subunit [Kibdelosporangium banguiense]|uniref:Proteasome subunit beta n=1 Tax=Kibdelosporangium banguiense TaxID=1365924 RepID=A0ABS4TM39_9PSEU|nr:proteasome subunit beta [Kibdelosporangium banguiense]MBP2325473.1 proteasome beta subunit [Kibdelosporangium banguiense]
MDSSFIRYLQTHAPELLPWNKVRRDVPLSPHGTTVLAAIYADGVMVAGDRRATMGNLIAQRDLEKVHPADEHSAIAFAGTVGLAVDLVKLFQLELEHYEKIEGVTLSIEGKVNKLGQMIRANLGAAQQGLAVIPLFGGYDLVQAKGRIFSTDVTGHVTEDKDFEAVGSGSHFAKGSLKKLYRPGLTETEVAHICIEALFDAADEDSATGGPDLGREIYPILATVTASGYRQLTSAETGEITRAVVQR